MYNVTIKDDVLITLSKYEKNLQSQFFRKIIAMKDDQENRHLKFGLPFFVIEVGQYRIIYSLLLEQKEKIVVFIGDHKEYEKWCKINQL